MTELLETTDLESENAVVHYELFILTGEEFHREKAENLYKNLYRQTPDIGYFKKLERLKK